MTIADTSTDITLASGGSENQTIYLTTFLEKNHNAGWILIEIRDSGIWNLNFRHKQMFENKTQNFVKTKSGYLFLITSNAEFYDLSFSGRYQNIYPN